MSRIPNAVCRFELNAITTIEANLTSAQKIKQFSILKQRIALMVRADWLVKLQISCAIYLRASREKMASGLHP